MSHIPNSAMPHAGSQAGAESADSSRRSEGRLGQLAEMVREHPKTTAAAGAAVAAAAGVAAAAALRSRGRNGGKANSGKKKSQGR